MSMISATGRYPQICCSEAGEYLVKQESSNLTQPRNITDKYRALPLATDPPHPVAFRASSKPLLESLEVYQVMLEDPKGESESIAFLSPCQGEAFLALSDEN